MTTAHALAPTLAIPAPSRSAGLDRLHTFLPRAGRLYAGTRNHDHGPGDRSNVSCLSAHVRHRLVTESEVIQAALSAHGFAGAEKFVQEQVWRTYWKGWLELRPGVWADWQAGLAAARHRMEREARLADRYGTALAGRTGIDAFDAWVGELSTTGYLHNHARMWFASIWIFTLRLPWELGTALFLEHLLDGDAASNTLSWRWVAGLQTKGKTYLARADNIRTYTGDRFDPSGLAADAPALTGPEPPPVRPLVPRPHARTLVADGGNTGLLLHEDDLHPESLGLAIPIRTVFACPTRHAHGPDPVAPPVAAWIAAALADGVARAEAAFDVPAAPIDTAPVADAAWIAAVVDWTRREGLARVVTAEAPVGPVADRLAGLDTALSARGVPLIRVRRAYDQMLWPEATKGFFPFKEKIPALLRRLDLG